MVTFASVFVILFFIFILQTVWLFIAELAGKDLDLIMVIKFLMFAMPRIVPLVLPLSVLLASIMTFGNLAENYEFAAMKSAGISLQRAMKILIVFICFLSIVAFFFANNVIPFAEYKFINFRKDIAQMKPAMAIAEGQFSDIGRYTIKVDKKSGENGNILTGITIHEKAGNFDGSKMVIKAKDGELISNENSNILKLVLNNGYYYKDVVPEKFEERKNLPFAKSSFKKYIVNMDLSKLNNTGDHGEISNTNTMLNVSELNYTLDSLSKSYKKDIISYNDNIQQRNGMTTNTYGKYADSTFKGNKELKTDLLSAYRPVIQTQILNTAKTNVESVIYSIDGSKTELEIKQKIINGHWIALYDKFVIAYACLLMFFIGAPLGAIIRKGGLGLPIVFAVLIFIIYHFINTFGKKVAQENGIPPFLGCWLSSFVLTPLAVILTYRATNDIGGIISFDFITAPFQKLFTSLQAKREAAVQPIVNLEQSDIQQDTEWEKLNGYSDDVLTQIVKNAQQFHYTDAYRNKALKILDSRGITQENLLEKNNLYNTEYQDIHSNLTSYYKYAKIAFILNVVSVIFFFVAKNNPSITLIVMIQILLMLSFYYFIFIAQRKIDEIGKIIGKTIEPGIAVAVVAGFPFYFFVYLYNNKVIKENIEQY